MRAARIAWIAALLGAGGAASLAGEGEKGAAPPLAPVAVVELFTSEGCSSCPPADRLLGEIAAEGDPRVFTLALHVDYWDRLGWEDPFGRAAHARRQQEYASVLGAEVYTPQAVVNGRAEMVGSRASTVREAIAGALARPATARILASAQVVTANGTIDVRYTVEGASGTESVVAVALVESGLASEVKSGENAGRRLEHASVVRALREDAPVVAPEGRPGFEGHVTLPLQSEFVFESLSVVAFVQRLRSREVEGATRTAIAR